MLTLDKGLILFLKKIKIFNISKLLYLKFLQNFIVIEQNTIENQLIKKVKEEALGERVIKSVKPQDQFISIMHEVLCDLMGKEEPKLNLKSSPAVIMLCGLRRRAAI